MTLDRAVTRPASPDIGAYCREVEACLTRENGGHLVRIVGPAFDLVRRWALAGVPLSVVFQGIAQKAERHRTRRSAHPLRLEFCEADVRALFDQWRRAVGVVSAGVAPDDATDGEGDGTGDGRSAPPSLTKHLDRALARFRSVCGRMDVPDRLRELAAAQLEQVSALRAEVKGARGPRRHELAARLPALQDEGARAARAAAPADLLATLTRQAEAELAGYRGRLAGENWRRAVEVTVDRLLRERFGWPTLEL